MGLFDNLVPDNWVLFKNHLFVLSLNKDNLTYSPGETVRGAVKYIAAHSIPQLEKYCTCKGIVVKVVYEGQLHHGGRESVYYRKVYMDKDIYVYGDGKTPKLFPRMDHNFNFAFQLPPPSYAPQTFVGPNGKIICFIEVVLVLVDCQLKPAVAKRIVIQNTVDLNVIDNYELINSPTEHYSENSLGILSIFQRNSIVGLFISTDKSGFVCGEIMNFEIAVQNGTNKAIGKSKVELIQKIKYVSHNITSSDSIVILSVKGPEFQKLSHQLWRGLIEIPNSLTPTTLHEVGCVRIHYQLRVCLDMGTFSTDIKREIPIIIGTVKCSRFRASTLSNEIQQRPLIVSETQPNDELNDGTLQFRHRSMSFSSAISRQSNYSLLSINRLPDYLTAITDVNIYMDPPPSYEEVTSTPYE